ncbi:MAG: endolytic transglycosylase MltG [Bowdeniella nasicola]|nr:endolytic transglycosylase MltG [Bowdeniella nasicola]
MPADTTQLPERSRRRQALRQRQRKRRRRSLFAVLVSLLVLATAVAVVTPLVRSWLAGVGSEPTDYPPGGTGEQVTVTIPEGASGADMAQVLKDADVILTIEPFVQSFSQNERAERIQPGSYTLRTKMSAAEAVNALLDPVNRADSAVTVPEGFHAEQVYERLASRMDIPLEEVRAAAKNAAAIGLPDQAGGQPEGWFAPKTYNFAPDTSATDALRQMVSETINELDDIGVPKDRWQEVLTKASIVEREAPAQYYGEVARVIENRMASTNGPTVGRLEMDSTVLYGLGKRGGVPTQEEVQTDTPYNTYIHKGLPPTPIGAPSRAAIEAVLAPPEGDWLYLVTINLDTGETLFTGDFEQHKENIQKLRDWRAAHPEESGTGSSEDAESSEGD